MSQELWRQVVSNVSGLVKHQLHANTYHLAFQTEESTLTSEGEVRSVKVVPQYPAHDLLINHVNSEQGKQWRGLSLIPLETGKVTTVVGITILIWDPWSLDIYVSHNPKKR